VTKPGHNFYQSFCLVESEDLTTELRILKVNGFILVAKVFLTG